MLTSTTTRHRRDEPIGGTLWARLVGIVHAVRRKRRIGADMAYLSTLDDHLLHDVGLTRADLERYLRGGRSDVWGDAPRVPGR
jgi:uncharacterized protein YjiS (DUF1127 family)